VPTGLHPAAGAALSPLSSRSQSEPAQRSNTGIGSLPRLDTPPGSLASTAEKLALQDPLGSPPTMSRSSSLGPDGLPVVSERRSSRSKQRRMSTDSARVQYFEEAESASEDDASQSDGSSSGVRERAATPATVFPFTPRGQTLQLPLSGGDDSKAKKDKGPRNIKVAVRVRPINEGERSQNDLFVLETKGTSELALKDPHDMVMNQLEKDTSMYRSKEAVFTYDRVFGPNDTSELVYKEVRRITECMIDSKRVVVTSFRLLCVYIRRPRRSWCSRCWMACTVRCLHTVRRAVARPTPCSVR